LKIARLAAQKSSLGCPSSTEAAEGRVIEPMFSSAATATAAHTCIHAHTCTFSLAFEHTCTHMHLHSWHVVTGLDQVSCDEVMESYKEWCAGQGEGLAKVEEGPESYAAWVSNQRGSVDKAAVVDDTPESYEAWLKSNS